MLRAAPRIRICMYPQGIWKPSNSPCGSSGSPTIGGSGTSGWPGLSNRTLGPAAAVPAIISSRAHAAASVLIRMRALIGVPLRGAREARGHPARLGCECERKQKCLPRLRGPRGGQALDPLVRGGGSPWTAPNQGESFPGNGVRLCLTNLRCQRISKPRERRVGHSKRLPGREVARPMP